MLSNAHRIWDRAIEDQARNLALGDQALHSLLTAHGRTMNGGVLHAVALLDDNQIADAQAGYRFFGLDAVADILERAREALASDSEAELDVKEATFDAEYYTCIPDDTALFNRFQEHLRRKPDDFAPL